MKLTGVLQGMQLQLDNGATVEVIETPAPDGRAVKVRYIDSPLWPVEPGTEETISADNVYGIYEGENMGAVR